MLVITEATSRIRTADLCFTDHIRYTRSRVKRPIWPISKVCPYRKIPVRGFSPRTEAGCQYGRTATHEIHRFLLVFCDFCQDMMATITGHIGVKTCVLFLRRRGPLAPELTGFFVVRRTRRPGAAFAVRLAPASAPRFWSSRTRAGSNDE